MTDLARGEVTGGKPQRLLHTVRHAAEMLDLGVSTVWKLIADSKLETVWMGASRRVTDASLKKFMTDLLADSKLRTGRADRMRRIRRATIAKS